MKFSEIASIAGRGGLFHVLKPTRSGVIVETLDDQRKKLVVGANQRVSILQEVSIYTTGSEESVPLEEVMRKIHAEFDGDPGVDTSDGEELKAFLKHVVPNYDTTRVYVSDMKKLVNWYKLLVANAPEVLTQEAAAADAAAAGAATAEAAATEAPPAEATAPEEETSEAADKPADESDET
ncbi:MAG: DUF5606 domain-containing protein [Tunicatimonas sp.]